MTTPLDPHVPRVLRTAATRVRAARDNAGTARLFATGALLGVLVLAVVMASTVRAIPVGPPATVAVLLLAAAVALGVEARPDRGPATVPVSACGLEDTSDTLRCGLPDGHTGIHLDIRAARAFEETLEAHIGDAGAYYRDGQGRPVPIDDVF